MNYIGNVLLIIIVLSAITLTGVVVAHWLYRLLYVGRKYPGVSVTEDVFILLFTIPSGAAGGYVVLVLPIGISLLLSLGLYAWFGEWPKDEPMFTMNNLIFSVWPRSVEQWRNLLLSSACG